MQGQKFQMVWLCGVEDTVSDTDGEGGRDQMTGVLNLSQEFGLFEGHWGAFEGLEQGCGVEAVLWKPLPGGCGLC